jgi:hypothetical protein
MGGIVGEELWRPNVTFQAAAGILRYFFYGLPDR